jgi:hypothetical protein
VKSERTAAVDERTPAKHVTTEQSETASAHGRRLLLLAVAPGVTTSSAMKEAEDFSDVTLLES